VECTILSIGTELSLGLIIDTNSQYIADKLAGLGIECSYIHIVRDNELEISKLLKLSLDLSDIIIINGGLGPTDDDVTRQAVARSLNLKLARDKGLDSSSLKFIRSVRTAEIKKRLLRQSYVPQGAIPFKPRIGSASGFGLNYKGNWIFSIPGVPREMTDMFNGDVIPALKKILGGKPEKNIRKIVLMTTDISETEIESRARDLMAEAAAKKIRIGITANPGFIKIILIGNEQRSQHMEKLVSKFKDRIGYHVYGLDDTRIGYHLAQAIRKSIDKVTISTAESITGGLIGSMITDIEGSSDYYLGGVIAYSNKAKIERLGVEKDLIRKKGAVSSEVCVQMAKGAMDKFGSHYGLAVTGYAGPAGDKGLVYCAVCGPGDNCQVTEKRFIGTREDIKFRTAQFIINELRIKVLQDAQRG